MKRLLTPRGFAAAAAALAAQALTLVAFALTGHAGGMMGVGVCALAWVAVLATAFPAAAACLTGSLALAALSVVAGGPGWLAVAAAAASVAAWDLTRLAVGGAPAADASGERRLLRAHLAALAVGLLPGLVLAALLGRVQLSLPFPVMLGLAAAALVALYRAAGSAW